MTDDPTTRHGNASGMTRRQLLQRLGLVGGSSLVMGTLGAWELMGATRSSKPGWQPGERQARVVILGGGISGLVAGYELGKLGYDCRILEARDFVGGLCWTVRRGDRHTEIGGESQLCRFDQGQYLNAGAWRIPHADTAVLEYCAELGVPLELFVNSADSNFLYEDDPRVGELSGRRVRLREVKADLWGSISELLAKAMDQGDIDLPLSPEDKERLLVFLVQAGYLDSADYVYRPPAIRGSDDRYDLGALLTSGFGNRARSLNGGTGGPDPVFQPVGGMQQIPIAFHRAMEDRVTLGAEVRSIRQTADGVRVAYRDTATGDEQEVAAEYCVCCLPMAVLKTIDVALSPGMAAAVERTSHSDSAKMGLQMKRRFWETDEGIFGGHIYGRSLELGEFSYPSNDYYTEKGVLLGFYGNGSTAELDGKPIRERVEHVLSRAEKVHPQMREEFETAYAVWWEKVPYSLGAYGRTPPEDDRDRFAMPDGRLYLGSAGTGTRPAWLQGAIESAWRTVDSLHRRVSAG
jgi:monoamine oxidase